MEKRAAISMGLEGQRVDIHPPADDVALDADTLPHLLVQGISTRHQLNLAEADRIAHAMAHVYGSAEWTDAEYLLTEDALLNLHRMMFGKIWDWAGSYRRVNTNLGPPWTSVRQDLVTLLENYQFQVIGATQLPYPADEVAIRFHHLLVRVHPFRDGNGRHARLAADLLAESLGQPPFSWGGIQALQTGTSREGYIAAIKYADREFEYGPLLEFARS